MRTKPLQYSLGLLALLGTVYGSIQSPVPKCTVKAWVRAPDLSPKTVVQGDARVKISAGCPAVETVMLGLRLKERSFIKALRSEEDRKRSATRKDRPPFPNPQASSPWDWPSRDYANDSDEIALRETLANRESWIVREEEQVVFETTQHVLLINHDGDHDVEDHDVVQDFAVLVPSTNFPPGLDYSQAMHILLNQNQVEIVDMESMYEYFIRVPFTNGTTAEISAGVTSFQPLYDPTELRTRPSSEPTDVKLKRVDFPGEVFSTTNYTAQITGISGSVFAEGSDSQATVIITRTGPARTFTAPLKIHGCVESEISSKWAVAHDLAGSSNIMMHRPSHMLRSTPQDTTESQPKSRGYWKPCLAPRGDIVSFTMPNSTADEVQSQDIVTTTSEVITIPIAVDHRHIPNFETYYQTLTNVLQIVIETPRKNDEKVDPDDPSIQPYKNGNPFVFEDDEEEWIPWEKTEMPRTLVPEIWHSTYSGTIPVVVRPTEEIVLSQPCLHVNAVSGMAEQVVMSDEANCELPSLIHYLDEGARGPVFVDRGVLGEVLAEGPMERERRAPILQSVVSSPPKGEELIHRYYNLGIRWLIYVGETWARKMARQLSL